jgi:hypothetical protein
VSSVRDSICFLGMTRECPGKIGAMLYTARKFSESEKSAFLISGLQKGQFINYSGTQVLDKYTIKQL